MWNDEHLDPLGPVSPNAAIGRLLAKRQEAGVPSQYLEVCWTRVVRPSTEFRERLLIDLGTYGFFGDIDDHQTVHIADAATSVEQVRLIRRIVWRDDASKQVERLLERAGCQHLMSRPQWFASRGLWPAHDDMGYMVDPAGIWPTWTLLGVDSKQLARAVAKGPPDALEQAIGHVARSPYPVLYSPITALRVRQDLIRIDRSVVRPLDGNREGLRVDFELGTLGWLYVLQNKPVLHFILRGQDGHAHTTGTRELDETSLKYGVDLEPPGDAWDPRVYSSRLEVRLNGEIFDWSEGSYIRSIGVSVGLR